MLRGTAKQHQSRPTPLAFTASSPESVEKSFYAVGGLVFEHFDAAFHLWAANKPLALADRGDGGPGAAALTSILDDLAKAPTGWT